MKLNDNIICSTVPYHSNNGGSDTIPGSCTAIVNVTTGKYCSEILFIIVYESSIM